MNINISACTEINSNRVTPVTNTAGTVNIDFFPVDQQCIREQATHNINAALSIVGFNRIVNDGNGDIIRTGINCGAICQRKGCITGIAIGIDHAVGNGLVKNRRKRTVVGKN